MRFSMTFSFVFLAIALTMSENVVNAASYKTMSMNRRQTESASAEDSYNLLRRNDGKGMAPPAPKNGRRDEIENDNPLVRRQCVGCPPPGSGFKTVAPAPPPSREGKPPPSSPKGRRANIEDNNPFERRADAPSSAATS